MLSVVDRQQITETLARHAFVVDENELDQLGEVFTPEATYDMTRSGMGAFQGIEAMRAAAAQMLAAGHAPLSHFVTNITITETGESTASVRSKGLMIMHDGALHAVVYDDTVSLHEGRWLIASRIISPIPAAAADLH
ncbi:SnoaL-like protein [Glaciihabitans tibetensis]|uniref:SnoaL-like protein n=1 Tax=Glaciihabitans tibetensis TaxID=1266600 RepID=A0A2T0VB47_9MICO|nr:nuclear transport factor 2 family protein [Glaciihabitans tibetensis]PRY67422.1 SnoaL-like protein [Glaciihabitans tibetensis]